MRIRVGRVVVAGAVALAGSALVAPSVSASPLPAGLRCGYATAIQVGETCPDGATNPDTRQPVGGTPTAQRETGVVLVAQSTAENTEPNRAGEASVNEIGKAPKSVANIGATVKPRTTGTPNTSYVVLIKRNDGVYNNIGTVVAGPGGAITLPAVELNRPGTYTFALRDAAGNTLYVRTQTVDEPTVSVVGVTVRSRSVSVTVSWAGASPGTNDLIASIFTGVGGTRLANNEVRVTGSSGTRAITIEGVFRNVGAARAAVRTATDGAFSPWFSVSAG